MCWQTPPGDRPDFLIQHPGGLRVVLEAEYRSAREVKQEAIDRLGEAFASTGEAIEQAIALRAPVEFRRVNQANLPRRVAEGTFDYCVFTRVRKGLTAGPPAAGSPSASTTLPASSSTLPFPNAESPEAP